MRDLDDLKRKVETIDRRIELLRAGRRQRRQQVVHLLEAIERRYRRQGEELAGARRQIKLLENVVGELGGKLQSVLTEVVEDIRESEAMVGRLTDLERHEPASAEQPAAAQPEPEPEPDRETTRRLLSAQEERRRDASAERLGAYDRELERLVREAKFFYEDL